MGNSNKRDTSGPAAGPALAPIMARLDGRSGAEGQASRSGAYRSAALPLATDQRGQLAWNDGYAIGVADIDAQHRELLDILNQINRAAHDGARHVKDALWTIFEELNEYAAYHFLSEEKLMQEHLPTGQATARHIAQHRSYWVAVSEFKSRYRAGDTRVAEDLMLFLNTWWIEHILGVDRQMGADLNRMGVR